MELFIIAIVILWIAVYVLASELYYWRRVAQDAHRALADLRKQWDSAKIMLPLDLQNQVDWACRPDVTGGTP